VQVITPCLWFDDNALEAAEFYVSLFKKSEVTSVSRFPADHGGERKVAMVTFALDGLALQALNGGQGRKFSEAVSFAKVVSGQAEVDRLWHALTADGGEPGRCGWLTDRFGLSWQIVPSRLSELLGDPDRAGADRAMHAMLSMSKIDISALEAAFANSN